jgi:NADPH-dependent ferric siderophore reductase
MSLLDHFDFHAQTALPGLPFDALHADIRNRAREHDLPVVVDTAEEIQIETVYGNYSFQRQATETIAVIGASRADWLFTLKDSLSDTIAQLVPDVAAAIRWSDAQEQAGKLPPNFQFITIRAVTRVPGHFLRVEAEAEDLSHFTTDAIHFRLALPDPDLAHPEWPYLSESGQTIWPKGDASLHRPVYTVREMDAASGRLVFDIFEHEGGRATEWARTVTPGTRVGLTGPGGGGIPEAKALRIYADETGFPAVARILETLDADAQGQVILELTDPVSGDYPLPEHTGLTVERRAAGGDDLGDLAIAGLAAAPDHMVWLAAEKTAAQKLRAHFKSAGLNAKDHYVSAYWTRPAPAEDHA